MPAQCICGGNDKSNLGSSIGSHVMTDQERRDEIRTCRNTKCCLCGAFGQLLYQGLEDRLFNAPGEWNLTRCSNLECGLVWLDPMPIAEEIWKAYQTYHTHSIETAPSSLLRSLYHASRCGYLQSRLGYTQGVGPRWYRHLSVIAYLHPHGSANARAGAMFLRAPKPGNRLLDVGCGAGYLLARMRDMGWQAEGIDVDPLSVEVARSRGIPVRLGGITEQNYPDSFFDAIHMGHVIEHVHGPIDVIRECHRVLKPGGMLVMLTPNTASWGAQHFTEYWRGLEPPRHLHLFNPKNIRRNTELAGFSSECIRTMTRVTGILSMSDELAYRSIAVAHLGILSGLRRMVRVFLFESWERILLLVHRQIGEEIVVIAQKGFRIES